jgi:hypothetical protein
MAMAFLGDLDVLGGKLSLDRRAAGGAVLVPNWITPGVMGRNSL